MSWSGCRRAAATYLALFFIAVAVAPHHHINDLEDLLLDQRSDSGIIVQTVGPADAAASPTLNAVRFVHDVPCLACFTRDFVCAPTASFLLVAMFAPLPLAPVPPSTGTPEIVPADASSRAPPLFA